MLRHWIAATRPKTLPAAAAPVLCASALAWRNGVFETAPACLCLLFALLVQVGTNFANDYFDFKKGADTPDRIGPTRAVAAGLISARAMKTATACSLTLAFLVGLALIPYGGWPLLIVGLASLTCAVLYTGGPWPLGYHGLGDLFVFIFFGLVAVLFTYFVQAGTFTTGALLIGIAMGCLSVNLLVVNNYRDVETDARAGKRTLAVRFGRGFARAQYGVCLRVALLVPLLLLMLGDADWPALLPLGLYPLGRRLEKRLQHANGREAFGRVLAGTAALLIAYALLLSIGLLFKASA